MDPRRQKRLHLVKTLEETIGQSGYECMDVELTHEAGRSVLRVVIDSIAGIGVEDCEKVSRILGELQEEIEPLFKGRYFLEVSSPGLERPLRKLEDFSRFQGSIVRVQLRETLDGQRNIKGKIDSLDGDKITLVTKEGNPVIFPFDLIRKANLVFEGKF